ncbi:hypothetical protein HanIR_Chr04g0203121 [Helianthus annuus]|nr:hypothetical protein HanIR_Chr04g0203121 [Helianthus annuus]
MSSAVKWRSWSSGRRKLIGATYVSLCTSCPLHDCSSCSMIRYDTSNAYWPTALPLVPSVLV